MADDTMKRAYGSVLEDMGRAAREGRARRFSPKPTNKQAKGAAADKPVDPVMSDADLSALEEIQTER